MATVTRRIANRKGSSFLTRGGDDFDHKGLNKARRAEDKALCRISEDIVVPSLLEKSDVYFRVVLQTQVYENHGTHDCECKDDKSCTCASYWKAKGGNEYIQQIGSANDVMKLGPAGIKKIVSDMRSKIEKSDRFYEEFTVDWCLLSGNEEMNSQIKALLFGVDHDPMA